MRSVRRERCVVCGERLGSHTRAGLRNCKAKLAEAEPQAEREDVEATADEAGS